jgi:predicted GNAT family N-acyltransferase
MAATRTPSEILELGKTIVKEIGLEGDTDTLGRWMCHYVAALIDQASSGKSEELRLAAQREAVSTILALWEKRTALPGQAYPLARFKYLLQCLAAASPDASIWELRNNPSIVDTAGTLFRNVTGIVNIALSLDSRPPLFEGKRESVPEISISFMKMIEHKILSAAEELDDQSLSLLAALGAGDESQSDPRTKALQGLLKAIETTQLSLRKLAEHVKEQLSATHHSMPSVDSRVAPKWMITVARKPLSQTAMEECEEILKEGASVDVGSVKRGLEGAKKIVLAKDGKQIVGLAAIKPFRPTYAAKVGRSSSTAIERGTIELGYVAVRQAYRQQGLGQDLVKTLLEGVEDPIFATTASRAMGKILSQYGFAQSGNTWKGQAGRLSLWKRRQMKKSEK